MKPSDKYNIVVLEVKDNAVTYKNPKELASKSINNAYDIEDPEDDTADRGAVVLIYENETDTPPPLRDDVYGPGWLALIDFKFAD